MSIFGLKSKVAQMSVKHNNSELADNIFAGLQIAIRKLYEKSAANNELMVVSVNGEVKHLPAKELLAKMKSNK